MNHERLADGVYLIPGAVNVGVIEGPPGFASLVDAGIDETAGKKVLRALDSSNLKPETLLLTHAHADHFGAAAFLKKRTGLRTVAPSFEAASMRNPLLEPIALYGGAVPAGEMTGKFLMAEACEIDRSFTPGETLDMAGVAPGPLVSVSIPGHTPGQTGYLFGGVLFCADAFFSREIWDKYGIPVYSDISQSLNSLDSIQELITGSPGFSWLVPSHGKPVNSIDEAVDILEHNRSGIRSLVETVRTSVMDLGSDATEPQILSSVCRSAGASLPTPSSYYLARMTVLACLTHLQRQGDVSPQTEDYRLIWTAYGHR